MSVYLISCNGRSGGGSKESILMDDVGLLKVFILVCVFDQL